MKTSTKEFTKNVRVARGMATELAREVAANATDNTNGSEAWQAVVVKVDGRSAEAKALKLLGFEKDYYWGFTISAIDCGYRFDNYFAEEAWTTKFADELKARGINARRVERLL